MSLKVKKIDESSFYVFTDPSKPTKVKRRKDKDKYYLECPCIAFKETNTCSHTEAIREVFPKIPWKKVVRKKSTVEEYIGGDERKQINVILKQLSF